MPFAVPQTCGTMGAMLVRAFGLFVALASIATTGCQAGNAPRDAGGGGMDAGGGGVDSGPSMSCATAADCDDSLPCTIDECIVGNVCEHTPLDSRCNASERCVLGRGCVMGTPSDCTTAADCQDGIACNGAEVCIVGMCVPGDAVDCNDNNACTVDSCGEPTGACTYTTAPGCDAGVIGSDAGPPCETFVPATHYGGGRFLMLPSQSCGAGSDMYSVSTLDFSVAGGTLTVRAGRFTLTQSPVPTGASFDVTGGDGCATVRVQGTFECSTRFTGTWTANHGAGCASCGTASGAITGVQ